MIVQTDLTSNLFGDMLLKFMLFFKIQVSAQFISSSVLWSSREKVFQMEGTVKG